MFSKFRKRTCELYQTYAQSLIACFWARSAENNSFGRTKILWTGSPVPCSSLLQKFYRNSLWKEFCRTKQYFFFQNFESSGFLCYRGASLTSEISRILIRIWVDSSFNPIFWHANLSLAKLVVVQLSFYLFRQLKHFIRRKWSYLIFFSLSVSSTGQKLVALI